MAPWIGFGSILLLIAWWVIYEYRLRQKENSKVEESLDDESLYIEGRKVRFEDLGDITKGDPEEGIKYTRDTMFREDLMQFEGEFLIEGLPLSEERRRSIDDAFLYVMELFGRDIVNKPILTRDHPIFPVELTDKMDIVSMAHKIAKVMDIDPNKLELGFFDAPKPRDPASVDPGSKDTTPAGLYYGKNEFGKFEITLANNIHANIEAIIATISHEFCHVKLLGEERMSENSEELTDMLPLFYGFGIFCANTVLTFTRENNGTQTSWESNNLGYLSFADWAYMFALYMHLRDEKEPEWFEHLNKTVAKDCKLALEFIAANPDKVL